ncbi:hypothetical protein [Rhizobium cremeum]|nr:hypothetical protein [Rhizobium cremeum]
MRAIVIVIIASILSILLFKYSNNQIGQAELLASPMEAAGPR